MAEQARFSTVVAKAGKPVVHLTWLAANKDTQLKAAIAAHRVMTIHQVMRGGRKDFGTVGFMPGSETQLLIFPKSLRKFADRRIVAIDYSLLADRDQVPLASGGKGKRRKDSKNGEQFRDAKPAASSHVQPTRPPIPVAAPVREEPLPLTWAEAGKELEKIRRSLGGRPRLVAAQIDSLLGRIKEKIAPH